ncbi:MarR family winged helix-turn-helix transcriptional regulator [Pelagimonas sp. KU-00592-HH]|uniref:MarR family winged helix-turn-helix transcriptional regulator n=1 Tax=Pelagimonas sp. KU-00592-HH TaxID=3127651 RepID=UPI00333F4E94
MTDQLNADNLMVNKRVDAMAKDQEETPDTQPDLQHMVTFRLSRLHARLTAQATKILKESAGISLMQWRVFVMIESRGTITPAEIVRQTDLDKSQLSRAVKSMVERGLITSETRESDQRAHSLAFTSKGLEVFEQARPYMRDRQARLLNALSAQEREALFAAFQKLDAVADDLEAEL